jgi:hypothetical protein
MASLGAGASWGGGGSLGFVWRLRENSVQRRWEIEPRRSEDREEAGIGISKSTGRVDNTSGARFEGA